MSNTSSKGRHNRWLFTEVGRLPDANDNVGVATRRLEAGDQVIFRGNEITLDCTILEGHRFAVESIPAGTPLLSWGLPFGRATQHIDAGKYVCNAGMLEALEHRSTNAQLPEEPNFEDEIVPYELDEESFIPAQQVFPVMDNRSFLGYHRSGDRGVGTRNTIVLLAVSSLAGGYVKKLEEHFSGVSDTFANIDGIKAVAHTEAGDEREPNNREHVLRTLAGFVVHPNVGAVLIVDRGHEVITGEDLRNYLIKNDYPLNAVPHSFLSLKAPLEEDLKHGQVLIQEWLESIKDISAIPTPVSELKIALQCGGSDSFSGISGNPLAAWVAREIVQRGGAANLAETDELIGAEAYVLQAVRDLPTARAFLEAIKRFKERAAWHGATAEGNPSGGNKLRGLYNIVLKSIGAAKKKHPDVRLDKVVQYGEPMCEPGYYFMDSPGNDLESIAGQVASGCNLIFFVTGNGSIKYFPFVPTIKIVTTTERFKLLSSDMDVNAGAFLEDIEMDDLGSQTFDLALEIASGRLSVGEKAGHSQVQIWRNWQQKDSHALPNLLRPTSVLDKPHTVEGKPNENFVRLLRNSEADLFPRIGLILPTSCCSGQIAGMAATSLNKMGQNRPGGIDRFVALVHTEGCGVAGVNDLHSRTLLGYLSHPSVHSALLLEHGCEITHNDFMRHQLSTLGLDTKNYGWASIQLDGGITSVIEKMSTWFAEQSNSATESVIGAGIHLSLGLLTSGQPSSVAARTFGVLTQAVVGAGGSIVIPQNSELLTNDDFLKLIIGNTLPAPTLTYGQTIKTPGFHIMEAPTKHWVETITGLGATGVTALIGLVSDSTQQVHPLLPLLQVTSDQETFGRLEADLDLVLTDNANNNVQNLLQLALNAQAGRSIPKLSNRGQEDFQLTRGLLGISL